MSRFLLLSVALCSSAFALLGEFQASCRDDGEYEPVQCHAGTNFCWCVDMYGKEVAGTRVEGSRPDCPLMTPCRVQRSKALATHYKGIFIPECDADGSYSRLQCHHSTGHCFCVDLAGKEIIGTRVRGTKPDCESLVIAAPQTPCQEWVASTPALIGAYRPQCDTQGAFIPRQCHGSTGLCWCVDTRGNEVDGTRKTATELPRCNRVTQCELERDGVGIATAMTLVGKFRPKCELNGDFAPMQCHGSTGQCWCVDYDGSELETTRVFAAQPECQRMTPCLSLKLKTKPLYGAFIPSCNEDGTFGRKQCWGSTGQCWCVDASGREVEGTRARGDVDCDKLEIAAPRSPCQLWAESTPRILGAYAPQCDEAGEFFPLQCHGSTGMCWCVDSKGNELAHTRVRSPRRPVCSQVSPCEVLRDGVKVEVVDPSRS